VPMAMLTFTFQELRLLHLACFWHRTCKIRETRGSRNASFMIMILV
jgi:hypothetical protein